MTKTTVTTTMTSKVGEFDFQRFSVRETEPTIVLADMFPSHTLQVAGALSTQEITTFRLSESVTTRLPQPHRERERERERERQRQRDRETERQRQTDRQTDRQTETETETDR